MSNADKINEFLALFEGSFDRKIICHSTDNNKVTRMFHTDILTALNQNLQYKKDVYFYVNNGGTKKHEITEYVALFVDLDTGRDENKNYFPSEVVQEKKRAMLAKVDEFHIKPNTIVETRNGLHVYWLIDPVKANRVTTSQWETAMGRLKTHFRDVGADQYVGKPNQIMRVPFTIWSKQYTGLQEFVCQCVISHDDRYSLSDILERTKDIVIHNPRLSEYIESPSYTGPASPKAKETWLQNQKKQPSDIERAVKKVAKKTAVKRGRSSMWKLRNTAVINEDPEPTPTVSDLEVELDIKEFLLEIAPQLQYKGMKYSSKIARELAAKLTEKHGI